MRRNFQRNLTHPSLTQTVVTALYILHYRSISGKWRRIFLIAFVKQIINQYCEEMRPWRVAWYNGHYNICYTVSDWLSYSPSISRWRNETLSFQCGYHASDELLHSFTCSSCVHPSLDGAYKTMKYFLTVIWEQSTPLDREPLPYIIYRITFWKRELWLG